MNNLNQVIVTGYVANDAKLISNGNTEYVLFNVANNYSKKTPDGYENCVNFIPFTLWGDYGRKKLDQLKKGAYVEIEARLKVNSWTNSNGEKISRLGTSIVRINIKANSSDKNDYVENGQENYDYNMTPDYDENYQSDEIENYDFNPEDYQ